MSRAPWPVMGSASEQLLARLVNAIHSTNNADEDFMLRILGADKVLDEAESYLAGIGQFADRMHARDMGRSI